MKTQTGNITKTFFIAILITFLVAMNGEALTTEVFYTETSGSFSLSGTYTKKMYINGNETWMPSKPSSGTLEVTGTAIGTGNAFVTLVSGHVNNEPADEAKDGGTVGLALTPNPMFGPGASLFPIFVNGEKTIPVPDEFDDLPLEPGTYKWKVKGKFERQYFIWKGTDWEKSEMLYTSNTFEGSWNVVHARHCLECDEAVMEFEDHIEPTCPDCDETDFYECTHVCSTDEVDFNKLNFQVYETLEVTVKKSDLYIVNLYIDGKYVTAAYPNSNGEAVLTKTFDTGDVGEHTVTIYMFYGNGSVQSTTYSKLISVTD